MIVCDFAQSKINLTYKTKNTKLLKILGKLKNDMLKKGFSSANDEINFFKRIKQK